MEQHVLMFSGGLDSYLAYLTLLDNGIKPKLVYVDHGSKNNFAQRDKAIILAKLHNEELIIDHSLNLHHWEEESAFIPNRNGFLAMIGALYGNRIWFAIMDGEQSYNDCRQDTFLATSLALTKLSGTPVTVDSPFWELTKAEVIERLEKVHYFNIMKHTYSCHAGGTKHCGVCSACFRRFVAFQVNGLEEEWKVNPWQTGTAETYYESARQGKYGKRDKEILTALEQRGFTYDR